MVRISQREMIFTGFQRTLRDRFRGLLLDRFEFRCVVLTYAPLSAISVAATCLRCEDLMACRDVNKTSANQRAPIQIPLNASAFALSNSAQQLALFR